MLKKVCILLLLCVSSTFAMNYIAKDQSISKEVAIQEAHWKAFELALENLTDSKAYLGKVSSSFRSDFEKDFNSFKRTYINSSFSQCNDLGEDGFVCKVKINVNEKKLRAFLKKKSNSTTVMGKSRVKSLNIVLIDNVGNSLSKQFTNVLHKYVNDSGHSLLVLPKGTPVGRKGNSCSDLEEQKKYFKQKGSSYRTALKATEKRLKECKENKNVEYSFRLESLNFNNEGKDSFGEYSGSLKYFIVMLNSQTGKREQPISLMYSSDIGGTIEQLKQNLYRTASTGIVKEINNNIFEVISSKKDKKKFSKLDSFTYMYTIKLVGLTGDREDRNKIRLIKSVVKKYGTKLKKNRSESDDFNQIYNFGTNSQIDLEEMSYELYDMADSVGLPINVTDEADDILSVQFH